MTGTAGSNEVEPHEFFRAVVRLASSRDSSSTRCSKVRIVVGFRRCGANLEIGNLDGFGLGRGLDDGGRLTQLWQFSIVVEMPRSWLRAASSGRWTFCRG